MDRLGAANRLVSIQAPSTTPDAAGQPGTGWAEVGTEWVSIRYQTGAEANRADVPTSVAKVSIRLRLRTTYTSGMRVVDGSTVYNILAVLPDLRYRDYMFFTCETGGNNG